MDIRVTSSPTLKSTPKNKKDNSRQLILGVRVYKNKALFKRFNFYVADVNTPVYVPHGELKNGIVIGSNAIRYNSLLAYTKAALEQVIKSELTKKVALNLQLVQEQVKRLVVYDFDLNFAQQLNKELTTIKGSGFSKHVDEYKVDKRVIEALKNIKLPNEPTVDPLGQVELNNIDAGDAEDLAISMQQQLELDAKNAKIKLFKAKDKYDLNLYNKSDIFELFGSIYFDEKIPSTYDKIVIRLYEYLFYKKPQRQTEYFNHKWLKEFFTFLWTEGYSSVSTQRFDPLDFDSSIFEAKERKKYNTDNLYKLFGNY